MQSNCLCILKLNSQCLKQIQTVSPCTQSNCLCILKLQLTVSNRKQQWNFILMVHKSLVALFSPGASCSTSPWYHVLHPLYSQSFSSAIGLLDVVQHLCSCTVQYFTSPLSLQREDSFITLDLNETFSVLAQNFAFLPWKLMSLSLSLISQHCMVVMLSMVMWPSACGVTCGCGSGVV